LDANSVRRSALSSMRTKLSSSFSALSATFSISIAGIVVPFACGFALGQFLPESLLPHPEARASLI
jgi:hypothetical protein